MAFRTLQYKSMYTRVMHFVMLTEEQYLLIAGIVVGIISQNVPTSPLLALSSLCENYALCVGQKQNVVIEWLSFMRARYLVGLGVHILARRATTLTEVFRGDN
jgi:hypothetical protein